MFQIYLRRLDILLVRERGERRGKREWKRNGKDYLQDRCCIFDN